MMTAYGSVDAAVAAMKEGAYDFVTKPLNLDAVELVLKRALHTRNLETANQELTTRIQADSGLQNCWAGPPPWNTYSPLFVRWPPAKRLC